MPKPSTTTPPSSPENLLEGFTEEMLADAEAKYGKDSLSANMWRRALEREKLTPDPEAETQVTITAPMGKRD